MKNLLQTLVLVLVVFNHESLTYRKRLKGKRHHKLNSRKYAADSGDASFSPNARRHGRFRQKHLWNFGDSRMDESLENIDEILEIRDNDQFAKKVFQMMKADDSDVLKEIDEDEEPSVYLSNGGSQQNTLKRWRSWIPQEISFRRPWANYADTVNYKRQMIPSAYNMTATTTGIEQQPSYVSPVTALTSPPSMSSSSTTTTSPLSTTTTTSAATTTTTSLPSTFVTTSGMTTGRPTPSQAVEGNTTAEFPREKTLRSSRVCKPGPPFSSNKRLPNCLLIGDSITLGSSYAVAAALQGRCVVQMSPFSKSGCALDSSYGLKCIPLILSTTNLTPTRFDAIVFNFGMHDIDYSDQFPEEFNNATKYARNLGRIKKILLKTGAGVAFSLTTPVTFNETKNKLVVKYNKIAEKVMSKTPSVNVIDLYSLVVDKCGKIPFTNCFMMKKEKDVHYGLAGSILLGKQIAAKIAAILKKRNLWVQRGYSLPENATLNKPLFTGLKEGSVKCSKNATLPTRCPSKTTCVPNAISRSNFACCMLENGVDCMDNFHCCPENTVCHRNCSPKWCRCIPNPLLTL